MQNLQQDFSRTPLIYHSEQFDTNRMCKLSMICCHVQGKDSYRVDKLADDMACLVKALGHESCTLVAHDWGGIISWLTAHTHSSLIDKLVVICAPHPKCEYDWDQYKRYAPNVVKRLSRHERLHTQGALGPHAHGLRCKLHACNSYVHVVLTYAYVWSLAT